jgi:parvulin-like peptidyl-prolyl isomerase
MLGKSKFAFPAVQKHLLPMFLGAFVLCLQVAGQNAKQYNFHTLTVAEIQTLLLDAAATNPQLLAQMREDPELRKKQTQSLRELLAFASQAQKEGVANDPVHLQELENIRSEVKAVDYDKEVNKGKTPAVPFGLITDAQVKAFWTTQQHEGDFQKFLNTKLAILRSSEPGKPAKEPTKDEIEEARNFFAKLKIYEAEFDSKSASMPKMAERVALHAKLQQAQYLARVYAIKAAETASVNENEIAAYIAAHSEFDLAAKKAKAEQILTRAKSGEDFSKLANEFTDDPGNNGADGSKQGGAYRNVSKGTMVPEFESAALSLKPGEVFPTLVESDFGYHVIKLETKNADGDRYDVRHILIASTVSDPADASAGQKPLKTFVRSKLEGEKEAGLMARLIKENNIQVPDDFAVPEIEAKPKTTASPRKQVPRKRKPVAKKR